MDIKDDKQVWSISFFYKNSGLGASVSEELDQELHKTVVQKFKRRKVHARFKENIWAAGVIGMGSLFLNNRGAKYFLWVIHALTKYAQAWVKLLRNKKAKKARKEHHLMYSTHNEGKSIVVEKFIKTLKAKIYFKKYCI